MRGQRGPEGWCNVIIHFQEENGNVNLTCGLRHQADLCLSLSPATLKMLALWKESYVKPRQHTKKQRHHFADKGPSSQSYGFSSGHVWM